jgi:hypothetical protein
MKPKSVAATVATVAVISGCGITQASVVRSTPKPSSTAAAARPAATHPAARPSPSATATASDPALAWLASPGGQEQVTFNDDVSTLAVDLEIEDQAPTAVNHEAFEADARAVRAEAEKILSTRALLPTVNRAAYRQMLRDFITVADLLQPGPGYGTTAEDWAAWDKALAASNIIVS